MISNQISLKNNINNRLFVFMKCSYNIAKNTTFSDSATADKYDNGTSRLNLKFSMPFHTLFHEVKNWNVLGKYLPKGILYHLKTDHKL